MSYLMKGCGLLLSELSFPTLVSPAALGGPIMIVYPWGGELRSRSKALVGAGAFGAGSFLISIGASTFFSTVSVGFLTSSLDLTLSSP